MKSQSQVLPMSNVSNGQTSSAQVAIPKKKEKITLRGLLLKYTRIPNEHLRVFVAETLGVMIYITVGLCSVAQFILAEAIGSPLADPLALYFGYSVGAMFAVLIVGKVSGPNLSTAISFARLVSGEIGPVRFLAYACAQFLGAFLGALWTWIIYLEAIKKHPAGFHSIETARIFSTYPTGHLSYVEEFFQQVVAVTLLVMVFLCITDKRNGPISHGLAALFVGFIILMKTCAFSLTLSNSINPARDFAPRLFTLIAGWGGQTFSYGNYWFWIPLVSPLVGSVLAVLLYYSMVSSQITVEETARF